MRGPQENKDEAIPVEAELIPNETLPVSNEVTDVDVEEIEELEAEEVPTDERDYINVNTDVEITNNVAIVYCENNNVPHIQMILFKYRNKRNNLLGNEFIFKDIHLSDDGLFNIELQ